MDYMSEYKLWLEKADENARLIIRGFVGSLVDLSRYTVSCVSDSAQEAEK